MNSTTTLLTGAHASRLRHRLDQAVYSLRLGRRYDEANALVSLWVQWCNLRRRGYR